MDTKTFDLWADSNIDGFHEGQVEIDEVIAPIIRELNLKGYKTAFCCSGHPFYSLCEAFVETKDTAKGIVGLIETEPSNRTDYPVRALYVIPDDYFYTMTFRKSVKRGEIYYYDFGTNEGSVQNGCRPVLVVQCDEGNQASETTIIAAITTSKKRYLPTHISLDESCGLREPSIVLMEQLRTVNAGELLNYVGTVTDEQTIRMVNRGLRKALGMWSFRARPTDDVRCLCSKCLDSYLETSEYIIRRLNPYDRDKHSCDKCPSVGYEYILTPRKYPVKNGGSHDA